jgi:hypothetical protein
VPHVAWAGFFNYKYVPVSAAEFMASSRDCLSGLKLYNAWEWGGYLGWRLRPWYRVYGDGRYIFHAQLPETALAASEAGKWKEFMERRGLDGALLPSMDMRFPTIRRYPDGTQRAVSRPWYMFYMPAADWALIFWDDKSLLFVDRGKAPAAWLAAHEYRWFKPKDEAAFEDAFKRGEIPAEALLKEKARHAAETAPPRQR